jgi:hypothetical protein
MRIIIFNHLNPAAAAGTHAIMNGRKVNTRSKHDHLQ